MPNKPFSPFKVGPSNSIQGPFQRKSDEEIRIEQRKNLSPTQNKFIDLQEAVDDFIRNLGYSPTDKGIPPTLAGKIGALVGNLPSGLAVAVGGGKNLKNLRLKSIENLKGLNEGWMPEWFNDWATYMLEKYPRIMAHQKITDSQPFNMNPLSEVLGSNYANVGNPLMSKLAFNKRIAKPETAFHETTHTLQRLTEPKMQDKYQDLTKAVGYENNPYEIQAREYGSRGAEKFNAWRNKNNPAQVDLIPESNLLDTKETTHTINPFMNKFNVQKFRSDPDRLKNAFDPKYSYRGVMENYLDSPEEAYKNLEFANRWGNLPSIFNLKRKNLPIRFPNER